MVLEIKHGPQTHYASALPSELLPQPDSFDITRVCMRALGKLPGSVLAGKLNLMVKSSDYSWAFLNRVNLRK